jgi:para-aminobenzoate synthetase component 1
LSIPEFEQTLNNWGRQRVPFLFMVDFEMEKPQVFKLDDINPEEILFDIHGVSNVKNSNKATVNASIIKGPVSFEDYNSKFQKVFKQLEHGYSFLTNLTIKTEVRLSSDLSELFHVSKAKYKLCYKNEFLVFSPEIFIQIRDNHIYAYPMKGTINASIPYADSLILNDQKELAEHVTIVDLIRNDLSQVAGEVKVSRFRYLDKITTNQNDLFQVSSEIVGLIPDPYEQLGTLLLKLLPAGSVSGAPKPKTLEIIRQVEGEPRGYYTGIVGIFDGTQLDSGVIIRFIERKDDRFFYRSGGGITTQSNSLAEFEEAIDKIYVPVN